MDKIIDHGGPVLAQVQVQPIFWGSAWTGRAGPSVTEITRDMVRLMSSPYMLGLSQYRGIRPGTILPTTRIVTSSEPPAHFTAKDLERLITGMLEENLLPDFREQQHQDLLYFVFLPETSGFNGGGFHDSARYKGSTYRYGCSVWSSHLYEITFTFSHELVEACTDADPLTGFISETGATGGTSAGPEIADWCSEGDFTDTVVAAAYWSNVDDRCILPRRRVRIELEEDPGCRIGAVRGEVSTLSTSIVGDPSWINIAGLDPLVSPTYRWWVDADTIGPSNRPTFVVEWSATAESARVVVEIEDANGIKLTGERRIRPIDQTMAAQLRLWCQIRRVVHHNMFSNPLWDPLRELAAAPPSDLDLEILQETVRQISELAQRLADYRG